MRFSKLTDIGKIRKNNEDYLGAWSDLGLFVVADGMGGHQAGEVASKLAVDTLEEFFKAERIDEANSKEILEKAIVEANERIYLKAKQHKDLRGMGTTITAGHIVGRLLIIGQVGDSRAYCINSEGIEQLTEDHSLVNELFKMGGITEEEAENHPQKNVLTRALGVDLKIKIDFYTYQINKGDFLLFCTDGLSGLLSSEEIRNIVARSLTLKDKVDQLVALALDKGGKDNITAVLVEVE